jgi:hypothetical protein
MLSHNRNLLLLLFLSLSFQGCYYYLLRYRAPKIKDFRFAESINSQDSSVVRHDGIYYVIKKDGDEYSKIVLYCYEKNKLVLIEFGSDNDDPIFDKIVPITKKSVYSKAMDEKGIYKVNDPNNIRIELCNGFTTRGYYFIYFNATIQGDQLILKQTNHRKFRRVMDGHPPDYQDVGLLKADTLMFRPF